MQYPKFCKGCVHLHPYYGNKGKDGKRKISHYICSAKQGGDKNQRINKSLKFCDKKMESWR